MMRIVALLFLLAVSSAVASPAAPPKLDGRWEGASTYEGKSFRLRLDVASRDGRAVARVDYPDYALFGVPFDLSVEGSTVEVERRPQNGPVSTIVGTVAGETITGKFTGAGAKDAPFTLKRTGLPASIPREEPVSFRNGDVQLAGTVVLPDGKGPFPAIVLTHGGSPEVRADALYHGEAVLYARAGVAALIYDKRSLGESKGGDWTITSLEDFAEDALAGLRALKARPDIDPKRIGVGGHSQGGWITPIAAVRSADVAFVVVTSASGINAMEQSIFHTSNMLRQAGFSEDVVKRAAALRDRLYERARTGTVDSTLAADLERASKEPWFETAALPYPLEPGLADGLRRLLLFEPIPTWERVKVPVLGIWGADDIHLPGPRSHDIVDAALARGGNADRVLKVIPGVEHGFAFVRPPDTPWDFPRRSPEFEATLTAWLGEHVVAKRG